MTVGTEDRGSSRSRATDAREANDRIAAKAAALHFVSRVPMLCECSTPGCRKVVMVGLADYHSLRATDGAHLIAHGHAATGSSPQRDASEYDQRQSA
ncbi:MAG TPA: hypothetical protein VFA37_02745 [Gaiellaceae bacterium]|nr:hypothetical protein [Gaiellaceae bacterium]